MKNLTEKELQKTNGGIGLMAAVGIASSAAAIASAAYDFYRGYRDAGRGHYKP